MALKISGIPSNLNDKLIEEYLEIKKRYSMNDCGPGQLKGGRFAEVLLRIFQHLLGKTITPFGTDIPNVDKTNILNTLQNNPSIDEHIRQKLTPLTRLLLDFRNNRDSAHLGGLDVNTMDTLFVMTAATWTICEIVRVYGGYTMDEAQKIIDALAVKEYPVIMEFNGDVFITRHDLNSDQEVLVLLYKHPTANFHFLFSKTRDKNRSRFTKKINKMVTAKLIGEKNGEYFIMPRGSHTVETESLLVYKV